MDYRKRKAISRGWFIVTSAIFIEFVYNIFLFNDRFSLIAEGGVFYKALLIVAEYLIGFLVIALFLCLFIYSKFLLKFWVAFFIILSSIFSYYMYFYEIFIDELLIGTIFETNSSEILGVFDYKLILWVLFLGVLPLIILYKINIKTLRNRSVILGVFIFVKNLVLPSLFCLCIFLMVLVINSNLITNTRILKNTLANYTPFNYIAGFYQHFVFIKNSNSSLEDIATKYNFVLPDNNIVKDNANIVLIIGESARADHHSFYGKYKRETNPLLSRETNITFFPNVISCGTLSRISVNCILSSKDRKDFVFPIKESNIISVFNSLGFETSFLSTQTMYDTGVDSFYLASKDSKTIAFANTVRSKIPPGENLYDEYLLPFVDKALTSNNKKRFIVIYLTGSHTPYYKRYPKQFEKFTPAGANSTEQVINSYDNTVLYSDYVISRIINKFKNSNSLIYYVSDHGESLGENGKWLHGAKYDSAPYEQLNVAQFVWVSDSMKKLLGNKYNNIKAKSQNKLSHDNVFPTLLNCIGVKVKGVNLSKSLCYK